MKERKEGPSRGGREKDMLSPFPVDPVLQSSSPGGVSRSEGEHQSKEGRIRLQEGVQEVP